MTSMNFPPLDISRYWSDLTDQLVELVDLIPDDRMNWSPAAGEWNFRGILLHIIMSRNYWPASVIKDGEETPDILREVQTKDGLKQQLRLSWERFSRFLSDPRRLDAAYELTPEELMPHDPVPFDGHWIAHTVLTHDVHHRADLLRYLGQIGVELPPELRRRPL